MDFVIVICIFRLRANTPIFKIEELLWFEPGFETLFVDVILYTYLIYIFSNI